MMWWYTHVKKRISNIWFCSWWNVTLADVDTNRWYHWCCSWRDKSMVNPHKSPQTPTRNNPQQVLNIMTPTLSVFHISVSLFKIIFLSVFFTSQNTSEVERVTLSHAKGAFSASWICICFLFLLTGTWGVVSCFRETDVWLMFDTTFLLRLSSFVCCSSPHIPPVTAPWSQEERCQLALDAQVGRYCDQCLTSHSWWT